MIQKLMDVQLVLYKNMENCEANIDSLRFINNLHTTTRQLSICSQIVKCVGSKQIPYELLQSLILNWSKNEEIDNQIYNISRGKLTENGKKTTAFKHYLELCISLGLIVNLNRYYSVSRISHVYLYLLNLENVDQIRIEKLFFSYLLFKHDADGILLSLDLLTENETELNQSQLQYKFLDEFSRRLELKKENCLPQVKQIISEKYRVINYIWKKPEKYAEHILIPRYEWMSYLGWIEIFKKGSSTFYKLTGIGNSIIKKIPQINHASYQRDINEAWLNNNLFEVLAQSNQKFDYTKFSNISEPEKSKMIGNLLLLAFKNIKSSTSFKIPLYDSLVFLCFNLLINENIVAEFRDVTGVLKKGCSIEGKEFSIKEEGRINETYILTRFV